MLENEDEDFENIQRRDKFGTVISTGSKKHKIIFIDEFYPHRNVARVIYVESYKKFNHPNYDEIEDSSVCHCSLI